MVAVVQLVEHQVVILGVAGSSPVSHPEAKHRLTREQASEAVLFEPCDELCNTGSMPPPTIAWLVVSRH